MVTTVARYTIHDVRRLLREIPRWVNNVVGDRREDRLVVKPPPLEEGPGLAAARERADLGRALQRIPIEYVWIAIYANSEIAEHCPVRRSRNPDRVLGRIAQLNGRVDWVWLQCLAEAHHTDAGHIFAIVKEVEDRALEAMNGEGDPSTRFCT